MPYPLTNEWGRDLFEMTVSRPFFYARSMEFIGLTGSELRQHML